MRSRATLAGVALCGAALLADTCAVAQGHLKDPLGWQRDHIDQRDGAPASIRSIVQGADGFIWLAARDGVFRYDGVSFELIPPGPGQPMQADAVNLLLALPNGDIVAGHDWGGISLIRGGRQFAPSQPRMNTIGAMKRTPDGSIWIVSISLRGNILWRYSNGYWREVARAPSESVLIWDMEFTKDGTAWILIGPTLYRLLPGSRIFESVRRFRREPIRLVSDRSSTVWLFAEGRVLRVTSSSAGRAATLEDTTLRFAKDGLNSIVFGGDGAIWLTRQSGTLDVIWPKSAAVAPRSEVTIEARDLLFWHAALSNREGNVWFATGSGIDRYRRTPFTPLRELLGFKATGIGDLLALEDGRHDVWIRSGNALFKAQPDGHLALQPHRVPDSYLPCPSSRSGVWLPDGAGSVAVVGGDSRRSLSTAGLQTFAKYISQMCAED